MAAGLRHASAYYPGSSSLLALLVEDNTPSIGELLIHTLHSLVSYEVIAVADATAALAVLAARPILLVITDYHLSNMRGDALASANKGASPITKVMLITAMSNWRQKRAGVDHCLIKPFPMRDVIAAVTSLLSGDTSVR